MTPKTWQRPRPASRLTSLTLLAAGLVLAARTPAAAEPAKGPSPTEAKVGVYIEMINQESNHVLQNLDSYAGRIADLQKGPTCDEGGPQSWVSSMGPNALERIAGYKKGLARGPALPGDAPAREMVEALQLLEPVVKEASEYYFLSKFHDDGCRRGREMHATLMAGFTRYARADQALRAYIDHYTDEHDAADLAELTKKFGKGLHYYHRKVMVDARPLMRAAKARPLDLEAVRARLAAFTSTVESADAAVKAVRTPRNADALYQGGYEHLVSGAHAFANQAGDFVRVIERQDKDAAEAKAKAAAAPTSDKGDRSRARPSPQASGDEEERGRALENLIITYNELVRLSNQVMYSKSMR